MNEPSYHQHDWGNAFIGLVLLGETLTGGGICRQPPVAVSPLHVLLILVP